MCGHKSILKPEGVLVLLTTNKLVGYLLLRVRVHGFASGEEPKDNISPVRFASKERQLW
jgi:hypothetical protein